MTTVDHDPFAEAILAGDEMDGALSQHVDGCASCASLAARVAKLRAVAPTTVPGPPLRLADRVLAATQPAGILRRSMLRAVAIAAAVLAVGGVTTILRSTGPGTGDLLLVAARRTEAAGTAHVTVTGNVSVTAAATADAGPAFASMPVELQAHAEAEWAAELAAIEAQIEAEVEAAEREAAEAVQRAMEEAEQAMAEAERAAEEAQRQAEQDQQEPSEPSEPGETGEPRQPGAPPPPPPPPARPERPAFTIPTVPTVPTLPTRPTVTTPPRPPRPPRPPQVGVTVGIDGSGAVDFANGSLSVTGNVRAAGDPNASADFAVAADGSRARVRHGGQWTAPAPANGPLASLLLDAGSVLRALRSGDEADELDERTVRGTRMRRVRFTLDASDGFGGRTTATASIDENDVLRELRIVSTGTLDEDRGVRWRADVTLHLDASGDATVAPMPPEATAGAQVSASAQSSLVLYPLGPIVADALAKRGSR